MKTLADLKPGQTGIIESISDLETASILMELGCVPGEQVLLENVAPLGDPIAIKVAGYKLSLRLREAKQVVLEN